METQINGIAASDGVGIAPAYLLTKPNLNFEKYHISDPNSEKARFAKAKKFGYTLSGMDRDSMPDFFILKCQFKLEKR